MRKRGCGCCERFAPRLTCTSVMRVSGSTSSGCSAWTKRQPEEKLRVAAALEALPELAEALRSAKLNWSVVRELAGVAVLGTERESILSVCRKTAREVERMVSGLAPGDRLADRRRQEYVRHVLRLEVGAETLATFREAMKAIQKSSDQRLDDDAALLLMAREILGGPGDAGRASYQVVVTRCEDCGRGFQHANGELIELDPAILEMCRCDAQNVPIARRRVSPPMRQTVPQPMPANSCRRAPTRASSTNSPAPPWGCHRRTRPRPWGRHRRTRQRPWGCHRRTRPRPCGCHRRTLRRPRPCGGHRRTRERRRG